MTQKSNKKVTMNIYLDIKQKEMLKELSETYGASESWLIRQAINTYYKSKSELNSENLDKNK